MVFSAGRAKGSNKKRVLATFGNMRPSLAGACDRPSAVMSRPGATKGLTTARRGMPAGRGGFGSAQ